MIKRIIVLFWCPRSDSNGHALKRAQPLKLPCMPIPPRGRNFHFELYPGLPNCQNRQWHGCVAAGLRWIAQSAQRSSCWPWSGCSGRRSARCGRWSNKVRPDRWMAWATVSLIRPNPVLSTSLHCPDGWGAYRKNTEIEGCPRMHRCLMRSSIFADWRESTDDTDGDRFCFVLPVTSVSSVDSKKCKESGGQSQGRLPRISPGGNWVVWTLT